MVSVLIQCSLTIEIFLFFCACVELGGESLKAPYIYGGNFDLVIKVEYTNDKNISLILD